MLRYTLPLLAVVGLVVAAIAQSVQADTPKPNTPSVITVKFVHEGVPVIADTGDPWTYVNGARCQAPTPGGIGQWTSFTFGIPILPSDRTDCVKLGDTIRGCREANVDCVEFTYDGRDQALEVDPTPASGSSRITTRFMLESKPVAVSVLSWRSSVGGTHCNEVPSNGLVAAATGELQFFWPPSLYASDVPACTSGAVVQSFDTLEYGTVTGSFVSNGSDTTFDIDVSGATALPRTGGPLHEHPRCGLISPRASYSCSPGAHHRCFPPRSS
jgi:hypothetical protein